MAEEFKVRTSRKPIDFGRIAAEADLPAMLSAEGVEVRRGMALCPFHDNRSTPALSIYRSGDRWQWKCHSCQKGGDAIDWIVERDKVTKVEAAKKLDPSIDADGHIKGSVRKKKRPPPSTGIAVAFVDTGPPEVDDSTAPAWQNPEWQNALDREIASARECLWSPGGRPALDWLRDRKIADDSIARHHLGFIPSARKTAPLESVRDENDQPRGLYFARGIVLPWLAPGSWYPSAGDIEEPPPGPRWCGANVRCLMPRPADELPREAAKCRAVIGSKRGFLYPFPDVFPTQGRLPMLVVEGEFDAIVAHQHLGHIVQVGTVGSATVGNFSRPTLQALSYCPWLLLATDRDAAGFAAARYWKDQCGSKARRVALPFGKDFNEFIQLGGDPLAWIGKVLKELDEAKSRLLED